MANRPTRAELVEQNESLLDKLEDVRDQLDEVLSGYDSDESEEPDEE